MLEDDVIEPRLFPEIPIKYSTLTIFDFTFSLAQKELAKNCTINELKTIASLVNEYKANRLTDDELEKLSDSFYSVPLLTFFDLLKCNDANVENGIMYDYYQCFEDVKSEEEIKTIINNDYLNFYPGLQNRVYEYLMSLLK